MITPAMRKALPLYCVGSTCDDATTADELLDAVRTELDLVLEGQDGADASDKDIRQMRSFLNHHNPKRGV